MRTIQTGYYRYDGGAVLFILGEPGAWPAREVLVPAEERTALYADLETLERDHLDTNVPTLLRMNGLGTQSEILGWMWASPDGRRPGVRAYEGIGD